MGIKLSAGDNSQLDNSTDNRDESENSHNQETAIGSTTAGGNVKQKNVGNVTNKTKNKSTTINFGGGGGGGKGGAGGAGGSGSGGGETPGYAVAPVTATPAPQVALPPKPSDTPSDERIKKGVKKIDKDLLERYKKLQNYEYKYKKGYGQDTDKKYTGIMAQDADKLGKGLTKEINGVKHLDGERLESTNAGAIGELKREIDVLKKYIGKNGK
jgi:hypothetical protein